MINIENVSFHYSPDRWIISDLNLKILPLTWNIIAGPDGSGKTTLAKLIKGILKPQIGDIIFTPANEINHGEIAYIAGGYSNSVVGVTVLDDICFGMENLRVSQKEMRKRVRNVLAWTGLEGFEDRLTHTLSGGETQKLCLADVLAVGAKVLILDESFSMLDNSSRHDARVLIGDLKRALGLTVIEITNRSKDMGCADTVTFLDYSKQTQFYDSPNEFLSSPVGRQWLIPQGGTQSLLNSFSSGDASEVMRLLRAFNMNLSQDGVPI